MPPTLYFLPTMPNSFARMTLDALGMEYELHELDISNPKDPEHKRQEYLKINPEGKAPAFVDGDVAIAQSTAIAMYACNKYGANSNLYPTDLKKRTKVNEALFLITEHEARIESYLNIRGIMRRGEKGINPKFIDEGKVALSSYERILSQNKYIAGDHLTIADLKVAPNIRAFDVIQNSVDLKSYPSIQKWLKEMSTLPYYKVLDDVIAKAKLRVKAKLEN